MVNQCAYVFFFFFFFFFFFGQAVCIYPTTIGIGVTQCQFLSRINRVWINILLSRLIVLPSLKSPVFLIYSWLGGGVEVIDLSFPRVLTHCETQIALSWIWTWVTDSIPYDNNHYTNHVFMSKWRWLHIHTHTHTHTYIYIYIYIYILERR